jgi:uncharacterized protein YtpQ (UPF0354 family)
MKSTQFTLLLQRRLRENPAISEVKVVGDLLLSVTHRSGRVDSANLANFHLESEAGADIEDVINRFIDSILEQHVHATQITAEMVVPIVRTQEWLSGLPAAPYFERLNEILIVVYVADTPKNLQYLFEDDLGQIGVGVSDLRSLSLQNLEMRLSRLEVHGSAGLYMPVCGGNFESSLILNDGFWSRTSLPIRGDFLIGIPTRDLLLITGSEDPVNVEKLTSMVVKGYANAYAISNRLFIRSGGRWNTYDFN